MAYITQTTFDNLVHVSNVLYNHGLHGLGKVSSSAYVKGINEPVALPGHGLFCVYVREWIHDPSKLASIVRMAGYTVVTQEVRFETSYVTFEVEAVPNTVQS